MSIATFMEKFHEIVRTNKLKAKEQKSLAMMVRRGICNNALSECNYKSLLILHTPSFFKDNRLVAKSHLSSDGSYIKRIDNWATNSELAIKLYSELSQIQLSQHDRNAIGHIMYGME
jgi:hypothetical protein